MTLCRPDEIPAATRERVPMSEWPYLMYGEREAEFRQTLVSRLPVDEGTMEALMEEAERQRVETPDDYMRVILHYWLTHRGWTRKTDAAGDLYWDLEYPDRVPTNRPSTPVVRGQLASGQAKVLALVPPEGIPSRDWQHLSGLSPSGFHKHRRTLVERKEVTLGADGRYRRSQ